MSKKITKKLEKELKETSVKDFITKVEEETAWLETDYRKKEEELNKIRKAYRKLSVSYKYPKKGKKNTKEQGKEYLEIVNELVRLDAEEGNLLKDMRDISVKKQINEELLSAFDEYIKQK